MAQRSSCGALVGSAMAWPVIVFLLALVVMIAASAAGLDLAWPVEPLTLSEAAALRDDGEAVRLILAGNDPNQRYRVRRDLIDARQYVITPLEAAVRIRRATMVELLLAHGGRPDEKTWALLLCSPQDGETVEVLSTLEQTVRRPPAVSCDRSL